MYILPNASKYMEQFLWERDELLLRMEKEAEEEHIPIISIDSAQFLSQIARLKKPMSILEIGTAIGYSTIWLARSNPNARVLSFEIDETKVKRARENIAQAGLSNIEILHRNAELGLPEAYQEETFDFMFFDAAKAQYVTYLDRYFPNLADEGVIITDNTFFHGLAFGEAADKRQAWIGEQIHQFNKKLFEHPLLFTTFLPIGDGIAISIKKK